MDRQTRCRYARSWESGRAMHLTGEGILLLVSALLLVPLMQIMLLVRCSVVFHQLRIIRVFICLDTLHRCLMANEINAFILIFV